MASTLLHYHYFSSLESTNTWSRNHCHQFHPQNWVIVCAEKQTHGKGRRGNTWHSPPSQNIYATLSLCLNFPLEKIVHLPQLLLLSFIEEFKKYSINATWKWPNDLMIQNKKLGGFLTETVCERNGTWVLIGFGINVNSTQKEMDAVARPATSLFLETGTVFEKDVLLKNGCERFKDYFEYFLKYGFSFFRPSLNHCLQKGSCHFREGNHLYQGSVEEIEENGSLRMCFSDGSVRHFFSGHLEADIPHG